MQDKWITSFYMHVETIPICSISPNYNNLFEYRMKTAVMVILLTNNNVLQFIYI